MEPQQLTLFAIELSAKEARNLAQENIYLTESEQMQYNDIMEDIVATCKRGHFQVSAIVRGNVARRLAQHGYMVSYVGDDKSEIAW